MPALFLALTIAPLSAFISALIGINAFGVFVIYVTVGFYCVSAPTIIDLIADYAKKNM